MASGILSAAGASQGQAVLSQLLFAVAVITFAALAVACFARGDSRPGVLDRFTLVAACGVVAEAPELTRTPLPLVLGAVALATWLLACATALRQASLRPPRASWHGIRGSWLLAAVASQSLAILASLAALEGHSRPLFMIGLSFWLLGLGLYAVLISVIVARLLGGHVGLESHSPDYWISMGALAISTLAGVRVAGSAAASGQPPAVAAILIAAALLTWVLATSWIPYLVVVEVARAARVPSSLRFEPARWSMVFPLGMYSVATQLLAGVLVMSPAGVIATVSFWAGLAVWLLAVSTLTTSRQVRREDWSMDGPS